MKKVKIPCLQIMFLVFLILWNLLQRSKGTLSRNIYFKEKYKTLKEKKKDDEDSQAAEMEARESAVTALLEMSE